MKTTITTLSLSLFLLAAGSTMAQTHDSLDINDVNARINSGGDLFWNQGNGTPHFKVPKNDGTQTIFAGNLWIGGKDVNNQLHVAAEQYSQGGNDFFPGPIMDTAHYATEAAKWNRVWKINKSDVDSHITHFDSTGYVIPQVFIDWPAHGDTTLGQSFNLAPFYDHDNDAKYDPSKGDAPAIKGDQTVLFIFNDEAKAHTESGGQKMRIQAIAMAYAFDCPQDDALYQTIFTNYEITNFSAKSYYDSYINVWTDFDVGDYQDDYVGCDVERGLYFGYNGIQFDAEYKEFPPAQGVMFLAGAFQDNDSQDNQVGIGNGQSLNGFGYGNGTVDDERMGMMHFRYFGNNSSATGSPVNSIDYYNYMDYSWKDGTNMYYGGNGHLNGGGDTSINARYMFPFESDPLGWGTDGNPQSTWRMDSSGFTPGDVRGVGGTDSFTWNPGSKQIIDMAYIFAQDLQKPYDSLASLAILKQKADDVREMFFNDSTTCGTSFSLNLGNNITGITGGMANNFNLGLFPNPANNNLFVKLKGLERNANYGIYNMVGQRMGAGSLTSSTTKINIENLPAGVYFIQINNGNAALSEKFVKQ